MGPELKTELEATLRSRKSGPECQAMIKLIQWHLERTKHALLTADTIGLHKLQGEAVAYYNILKMFSREDLPSQR